MSLLVVQEGQHSELGPSSAERWLVCPASVLATRGVPEEPSLYALTGTAAHTVSELVRTCNKPASAWLGNTVRVVNGERHWNLVCDQEMVDSVQTFVDKVNEYPGFELCEVRVAYEEYAPGGFGTLDSAKLTLGLGRVTDFKHGTGVKKWARENPQLMLYALGILLQYDWLYGFEKFVLAICQPRLDHYDEWEVSRGQLLAWAQAVVAPGAARALEEGAEFVPGEVQCQFCRIKATCRARARSVFEAAVGDFEEISDVATALAAAKKTIEPAELTPDEIGQALKALPNVKAWAKAVEAFALQEALQGRPLADTKLVAGKTSRSWKPGDDALLSNKLAEATGRPLLDFWTPPELLSVAKVEKLIGKTKFKKIEAEFSEKSKGKPTLALASDPRPALALADLAGFTDLGADE